MKRQKRKFEKPLKLWDKSRIDEDRKLIQDYGLRRKKEIWKAESILRNYRRIARSFVGRRDIEREKILFDKLFKMGLVGKDADLDDVLVLTVGKILDRRLQTLVFKKGLANSIKQSRQFIVHGHISLDGRKITWPSKLVTIDEEDNISFYEKSKIKGVKLEKK